MDSLGPSTHQCISRLRWGTNRSPFLKRCRCALYISPGTSAPQRQRAGWKLKFLFRISLRTRVLTIINHHHQFWPLQASSFAKNHFFCSHLPAHLTTLIEDRPSSRNFLLIHPQWMVRAAEVVLPGLLHHFLVSYDGEATVVYAKHGSEVLSGAGDKIKFINFRFGRGQVVRLKKRRRQGASLSLSLIHIITRSITLFAMWTAADVNLPLIMLHESLLVPAFPFWTDRYRSIYQQSTSVTP